MSTRKILDADELAALRDGADCDVALGIIDSMVEKAVSEGRIKPEEVPLNAEIALEKAFFLLNSDTYAGYWQAAEMLRSVTPEPEDAAIYYYRLCAAEVMTAQMEKALAHAAQGLEADMSCALTFYWPAVLEAVHGSREKALSYVQRALELVPGDYEFTRMEKEIREGAPLEVLLFHSSTEEGDRDLADPRHPDTLLKRRAVNNLVMNEEGLNANVRVLGLTDVVQSGRDVTARCAFEAAGSRVALPVDFEMTVAGLSNLPADWLEEVKRVFGMVLTYERVNPADIERLRITLEGVLEVHYRNALYEPNILGIPHEYFTEGDFRSILEGLEPRWQLYLFKVVQIKPEEQIAILESIPEGERPPALTCELARAYNNFGDAGSKELRHAVALLESIREWGAERESWNFRMGYALYFLDERDLAWEYFDKAAQIRPHPHTKWFLKGCQEYMNVPLPVMNFRERLDVFWDSFEEQSEGWLERLRDDPANNRDVAADITALLTPVLRQSYTVWVEPQPEMPHLIIVNNHDIEVSIFAWRLKESMPEALREFFTITNDLPRLGDATAFEFTAGGKPIPIGDILVRTRRTAEFNALEVQFYIAALQPLNDTLAVEAFGVLRLLMTATLGQAAVATYINRTTLLREPGDKAMVSYPEFVEQFFEQYPKAREYNVERYLLDTVGFDFKREGEIRDYPLFDITEGECSFAVLLSNYYEHSNKMMNVLNRYGASAAMVLIEVSGELPGEEKQRREKALALELQSYMRENGEVRDVCHAIGWASGRYRGYSLAIVWDYPGFLEALHRFGEAHAEELVFFAASSFYYQGNLMCFIDRKTRKAADNESEEAGDSPQETTLPEPEGGHA